VGLPVLHSYLLDMVTFLKWLFGFLVSSLFSGFPSRTPSSMVLALQVTYCGEHLYPPPHHGIVSSSRAGMSWSLYTLECCQPCAEPGWEDDSERADKRGKLTPWLSHPEPPHGSPALKVSPSSHKRVQGYGHRVLGTQWVQCHCCGHHTLHGVMTLMWLNKELMIFPLYPMDLGQKISMESINPPSMEIVMVRC
jgi:hypothetical protein